LAIGFVIIAGGYAVGAISGAAFNPAVSIAIDLSSANKSFGMCAIYCAASFLGSVAAVALFKLVRPEEFSG
jgi:aquaporin Z